MENRQRMNRFRASAHRAGGPPYNDLVTEPV